VLSKKLTVLVAAVMMLGVMSVSPAMAASGGEVCDVVLNPDGTVASEECPGNSEIRNKNDDGPDANKGGGQEHIKNPRPPKGGANHDDNGGGND
jgi:hypothetical protein